MIFAFLESCTEDLAWVRHYYEDVFPEGAENAALRFETASRTLLTAPYAGKLTSTEGVRHFTIQQTPFAYFYQVEDDRIEVLRVWDSRKAHSPW